GGRRVAGGAAGGRASTSLYNAPSRRVCPTAPPRFPCRRAPMPISVTFLEQGKRQPAQVAALLADFLAAARASLHVAIYDFRLSPALAAPVVQALPHPAP